MNRPGREDIGNRIMEMVNEMFRSSAGYDKDTAVDVETRIQDDMGFDSVMLIILQINIEDTFGIRFNPVEENLQEIFVSVRTLTDYVQRHIGE